MYTAVTSGYGILAINVFLVLIILFCPAYASPSGGKDARSFRPQHLLSPPRLSTW